MITSNQAVVGRIFKREIVDMRGLSTYDNEFLLTEEWMGKLFSGDLSISLNDLHPIPLTPDWLRRLNFTEHCEGNEYRIGLPLGNGTDLVIEVLQMQSGPYDALISDTTADEKPNNYSYVKQVRSVHQLQSLFSALTGDELIFTK